MVPAMVAAPILAALCLVIAAGRAEAVTPWVIATIVAAVAAIVSRLFYDRSLLKREGPDRWV